MKEILKPNLLKGLANILKPKPANVGGHSVLLSPERELFSKLLQSLTHKSDAVVLPTQQALPGRLQSSKNLTVEPIGKQNKKTAALSVNPEASELSVAKEPPQISSTTSLVVVSAEVLPQKASIPDLKVFQKALESSHKVKPDVKASTVALPKQESAVQAKTASPIAISAEVLPPKAPLTDQKVLHKAPESAPIVKPDVKTSPVAQPKQEPVVQAKTASPVEMSVEVLPPKAPLSDQKILHKALDSAPIIKPDVKSSIVAQSKQEPVIQAKTASPVEMIAEVLPPKAPNPVQKTLHKAHDSAPIVRPNVQSSGVSQPKQELGVRTKISSPIVLGAEVLPPKAPNPVQKVLHKAPDSAPFVKLDINLTGVTQSKQELGVEAKTADGVIQFQSQAIKPIFQVNFTADRPLESSPNKYLPNAQVESAVSSPIAKPIQSSKSISGRNEVKAAAPILSLPPGSPITAAKPVEVTLGRPVPLNDATTPEGPIAIPKVEAIISAPVKQTVVTIAQNLPQKPIADGKAVQPLQPQVLIKPTVSLPEKHDIPVAIKQVVAPAKVLNSATTAEKVAHTPQTIMADRPLVKPIVAPSEQLTTGRLIEVANPDRNKDADAKPVSPSLPTISRSASNHIVEPNKSAQQNGKVHEDSPVQVRGAEPKSEPIALSTELKASDRHEIKPHAPVLARILSERPLPTTNVQHESVRSIPTIPYSQEAPRPQSIAPKVTATTPQVGKAKAEESGSGLTITVPTASPKLSPKEPQAERAIPKSEVNVATDTIQPQPKSISLTVEPTTVDPIPAPVQSFQTVTRSENAPALRKQEFESNPVKNREAKIASTLLRIVPMPDLMPRTGSVDSKFSQSPSMPQVVSLSEDRPKLDIPLTPLAMVFPTRLDSQTDLTMMRETFFRKLIPTLEKPVQAGTTEKIEPKLATSVMPLLIQSDNPLKPLAQVPTLPLPSKELSLGHEIRHETQNMQSSKISDSPSGKESTAVASQITNQSAKTDAGNNALQSTANVQNESPKTSTNHIAGKPAEAAPNLPPTPRSTFEARDLLATIKNHSGVTGQQKVELTLRPEALGKATALIEKIGDMLKLEFKIESLESKAAVEAETSHLRESLAAAGYNNVTIEFSLSTPAKGDSQTHAEPRHQRDQQSQDNLKSKDDEREEPRRQRQLTYGYNSFEMVA